MRFSVLVIGSGMLFCFHSTQIRLVTLTDGVCRNYYWRQAPSEQAYIQSVEGLFIGEMVTRLQQVINRDIADKYFHGMSLVSHLYSVFCPGHFS